MFRCKCGYDRKATAHEGIPGNVCQLVSSCENCSPSIMRERADAIAEATAKGKATREMRKKTKMCVCGTERELQTDTWKRPRQKYYECQNCDFRESEDDARLRISEGPAPNCKCTDNSGQPLNVVSIPKIVKKGGPNRGKTFWCCSRGQKNGCGFFQWKDYQSSVKDTPPKSTASASLSLAQRERIEFNKEEACKKRMAIASNFSKSTSIVNVSLSQEQMNRIEHKKEEARKKRMVKRSQSSGDAQKGVVTATAFESPDTNQSAPIPVTNPYLKKTNIERDVSDIAPRTLDLSSVSYTTTNKKAKS